MGFFSGSHGEHEIVNNAAPEIFIRTRGRRGHNDSKYYGALFNLFGSTGVFDSILRRLNGQKGKQTHTSNPGNMTMNNLEQIVKILTKPYKWYVSKFQDSFFPKFQTCVFNRLSTLNNLELQSLDQNKLNNILHLVEKLLLETIDNFSGDEMLEKFQLQLSRTLLTCNFLNKRLLGVELLVEWIQRTERKDNCSATREEEESKYNHNNRRALPKSKWLGKF